jgi:hypothetical protein
VQAHCYLDFRRLAGVAKLANDFPPGFMAEWHDDFDMLNMCGNSWLRKDRIDVEHGATYQISQQAA